MECNYDLYMSNRLAEYEERRLGLCECVLCGRQLYNEQTCYYIYGEYYCEDCIEQSRVQLDPYDPDGFDPACN